MVKRIVVFAALVIALMVAVKDGRLLRSTGITASCSVVQTATDGTQLEACKAGKLEGRPDLSARSCTDEGLSGTYEYWKCPAALLESQAGR